MLKMIASSKRERILPLYETETFNSTAMSYEVNELNQFIDQQLTTTSSAVNEPDASTSVTLESENILKRKYNTCTRQLIKNNSTSGK